MLTIVKLLVYYKSLLIYPPLRKTKSKNALLRIKKRNGICGSNTSCFLCNRLATLDKKSIFDVRTLQFMKGNVLYLVGSVLTIIIIANTDFRDGLLQFLLRIAAPFPIDQSDVWCAKVTWGADVHTSDWREPLDPKVGLCETGKRVNDRFYPVLA